ncbi:YbaB/EbfC family nucleoid-associated protein [Kutzneria kofuensis]|uniref:DNA-binding protein YbaB n=1 Tax=Kutzneria kofuensis TaxID=103725 RepID=A0A7W9KJ09_9PSEU|nr:YbaB/EbfC family nucleoid-associated protein [Kutzneria kofuensis]MBB5893507.1 DNA-binding protein YbaB [Kutzneria kofuensis]
MPVDHQAEIDQLMADYRRSREQLVAVQRGMAAIRETVTSHDDLVTVTVGPRGTLVDLVIDDRAYQRLRPAELAELIVRTTDVAVAGATKRMHDQLAPVLPAGADPESVLSGRADVSETEIEPEQPAGRHVRKSREDDSFENRNWVVDGRHA